MSEKTYHLSPFGGVRAKIEKKYYSLSHPQKRELITEKTYRGTNFGNMPFTVKFSGEVNYELLEKAINLVIYKNEGLRFRLAEINYNYKQYIEEYKERKFDFLDFSSKFGKGRYEKWLREQIKKPFEITESDLFYFALIKWSEKEGGFYINAHHIIGDGWTMKLLIDEIIDIYGKLKEGYEIEDEKYPSYTEYLKNEEDYLNSRKFEEDKKFWSEKFKELPEDITLPWNKRKDYDIKSSEKIFPLDPELSKNINDFSEKHKTSFYRLVTAAIFIYLSRIVRTSDITAGILTHNRSTEREGKMAGMFVNTFPLRLDVKENITFKDFIEQSGSEMRYILKNHSRYPYDIMIKDLREKHGAVPNLLNIILVGQNFSSENAVVEYHHPGCEQPPYHLLINIILNAGDGKQELLFTFPEKMYEDKDLNMLFEHIINILKVGMNNPDEKISKLNFLSHDETGLLLKKFNDTEKDYPTDTTIIEHFQEEVERNPDNTAVVFKDKKLSYGELNEKANQTGRYLREKGVKPEDIVAIMAEPSPEMIEGTMGILKSGAAYMPLDPAYPDKRIKYMLQDSGCSIIFTHKHFFDRLKGFSGEIIDLADEKLSTGSKENLERTAKPGNLAYIIYTSGSTGKPKGVMIEHRSLVNLCFNQKDYQELKQGDRISKYAGFAFDASVFEIFPALIWGATLYVIGDELRMSPRHLSEYFDKEGINKAFLPTQFVEQFM